MCACWAIAQCQSSALERYGGCCSARLNETYHAKSMHCATGRLKLYCASGEQCWRLLHLFLVIFTCVLLRLLTRPKFWKRMNMMLTVSFRKPSHI